MMVSEVIASFDDSGTDAGNPSLVVAGFGGCADQWRVFDAEQSEVCAEFGVVRFKAKEFNDGLRGFGQYGNWTRDRREGFLNRLLTVIKVRTSMSFATLVDKQAYQRTIAPQKDLVEYFYSPFAFASFNCIYQVCDWRNASLAGAPIGFYFDRGARNEGQLKDVAKRVLIGPDRAVEDVRFADDAHIPGLQAADLLAFELCAEARNSVSRPGTYSRYPLLKLDEHPHEWLSINASSLGRHIEALLEDGTLWVAQVKWT